MRTSAKFLTAATVAGLTFAAGSAFTGAGVTNNAGATQFIGGTVTQTVTGATLNSVVYGFSDAPANTTVNEVTLTFGDTTDGKIPTIALTGGAGTAFTCTAIDPETNVSSCTGGSQADLESIAVTVN
ncbi:hypothetical protein ACFQ36_11640 [Arthrobacter sp. GCM10027362]|uniref:hypothetical protein n=1 Tax=Arthrobacter sp. GCM10027362 TaxID=3273379 RepID=UPI003638B3AB